MATAAQLKKLRKKFHLGEFAKKKRKSGRKGRRKTRQSFRKTVVAEARRLPTVAKSGMLADFFKDSATEGTNIESMRSDDYIAALQERNGSPIILVSV